MGYTTKMKRKQGFEIQDDGTITTQTIKIDWKVVRKERRNKIIINTIWGILAVVAIFAVCVYVYSLKIMSDDIGMSASIKGLFN